MEGPYKLLPAEQAWFGNLAGSAGRSLYGPSMFYLLGFQTKCIWNLWGKPIQTAQVPSMLFASWLDSPWPHCENNILAAKLDLAPVVWKSQQRPCTVWTAISTGTGTMKNHPFLKWIWKFEVWPFTITVIIEREVHTAPWFKAQTISDVEHKGLDYAVFFYIVSQLCGERLFTI